MAHSELIKKYRPVIKAAVELLDPFLEVAVHDIESGKVTEIYGNLTNRKVGIKSPIKELGISTDGFPEVFKPYYEVIGDGRKIKCSTVTIRDKSGEPKFLICYNFDISIFQSLNTNLDILLQVDKDAGNPVSLYADDWKEQVEGYIGKYLQENAKTLDQLEVDERKEIVQELSDKGVFFMTKSAPFVANKLGISRATVYNYLKSLRAE